ncbi:MAG: ABC transporter substrate-binding protein [Deltaproteobacteria bacterium]|nr:ABC transporter substrate-binding protein [Deltaproteobacteria bacterium]
MPRTKLPATLKFLALLLLMVGVVTGCKKKDQVVFGVVLPLSGESAIYGTPIAQGIEIALADLQKLPDAPEMVLEIVDSEGDPEKGKALLEELYTNGARAAIGGVTTPEALAMVEVADRNNRVLISPSASARELTGISRNFYRVWPSDSREGSKMGQYAALDLKLETAAILAADSTYAEGIQSVFAASFQQNGGEITEMIVYPKNTDDLTALVERVVSVKPDGVYIADYADTVVEIIKLLKEQGFAGRILTVSAFAAPQAIAAAGGAAEQVFITAPQYAPEATDNAMIVSFVETYQGKFQESPGVYAAHGYDAMLVAYHAMQNGGDRGSNFWKGMRSISELQGVTGLLQFDEKGDPTKFPRVYFMTEGKTVDHQRWRKAEMEKIKERLNEINRERKRILDEGKS